MHSPDEFWIGLLYRLLNFMFAEYSGRQKVKRLEAALQKSEASLSACKRTMKWAVPVASLVLFGLCLFAGLALSRAYNRA